MRRRGCRDRNGSRGRLAPRPGAETETETGTETGTETRTETGTETETETGGRVTGPRKVYARSNHPSSVGRLEARLIGVVVGLGILTAVSVVVADLGDEPAESVLTTASVPPPESRTEEPNETSPVPPIPPTTERPSGRELTTA